MVRRSAARSAAIQLRPVVCASGAVLMHSDNALAQAIILGWIAGYLTAELFRMIP
jgi:hypothetical protein